MSLTIISAYLDGSVLIIEYENHNTKSLNSGYELCQMKSFLSLIDSDDTALILRAYHWLNWHSQSKYCGQCSNELEAHFKMIEKKYI